MWTLTKRAPNAGAWRSSWASRSIDRSNDVGFDPARFTRYEAWIETGAMSNSTQALAERRQFGGWLGAALPGRRVVGEDLHRARPDLVGAVDRLDHAGREGQVRTDSSAIGEHGLHRTMARWTRMRSRIPPSRRA